MPASQLTSMTDTRSLGLRELRENRAISLETIAGQTRISQRFLQAIEQEDFAALPGGVYNVSYIRQYAVAIGYDQDALLQWHDHKMGIERSGQRV